MEFKEKDRVRSLNSKGSLGTVIQVRKEAITNSASKKAIPQLIKVQWDNGTSSYFDPSSLEKIN